MNFFQNYLESQKKFDEAQKLFNIGNYHDALKFYDDAMIFANDDKSKLGFSQIGIANCYHKLGDEKKANKYYAAGCNNLANFWENVQTDSAEERFAFNETAEEMYILAEKFEFI